MLPKIHRLNLRLDFKLIVGTGVSRSTPTFRLSYLITEDLTPKIGIALSGKTFKTAPLKHRAKRLTSKAIEELYPNLRPGLKLVIIPKQLILEKTPNELTLELANVKDIFTTN